IPICTTTTGANGYIQQFLVFFHVVNIAEGMKRLTQYADCRAVLAYINHDSGGSFQFQSSPKCRALSVILSRCYSLSLSLSLSPLSLSLLSLSLTLSLLSLCLSLSLSCSLALA